MDPKYCITCDEEDIEKLPGCPLQCMSDKCKAYQKESEFNPLTKPIIWLLGGPGCGKNTQCEKIIEKYGYTHLSTGDIIRAEVHSGSDRARCLSSIMERGGLVPNDLILAIVKEAMIKAAEKGAKGYLVDGYPREKTQGIDFEKTIGPVALILYFEASIETLIERLQFRAATSGRKDDKMSVIEKRIVTFMKHNKSLIDYYGDRVARINAERHPDQIFVDVQAVLEPVVAHAHAVEAELAKQRAIERAKLARAYAKSSLSVAKISGFARSSMTIVGQSIADLTDSSIDDLLKTATAVAAKADAEAERAEELAEEAKQREAEVAAQAAKKKQPEEEQPAPTPTQSSQVSQSEKKKKRFF